MPYQLNGLSQRIEQLQKELEEVGLKYDQLYLEMQEQFLPSLNDEEIERLSSYIVPMTRQVEKQQGSIQLFLKENKEVLQQLNEKKRIISQILENQEKERQHIADNVLDSILQVLYSCMLAINVIRDEPISKESKEYLNSLKLVLETELDKLKVAALHLYPTSLTDLGLLGATKHYYTFLKNKYILNFDLQIKGKIPRYEMNVEIKVFRLVEFLLLLLNKIPQGEYVLSFGEDEGHMKIVLAGLGVRELGNLPEFSWIFHIVQCIDSIHLEILNKECISVNIKLNN